MTIRPNRKFTLKDDAALALNALGWILADQGRAQRFLDLTGLTPDGLRTQLDDPATHHAVFAFLAAYEPDLKACAAALDVPPETLAVAGEEGLQ